MNAAMVDRYSSWVERRASRTCTADAGPTGNDGGEGVGMGDSMEDMEDPEEEMLVALLCLEDDARR